ncbi:MAG: efflux RND transporter periplasmic adaptor subunit [Brevundimonas sp.]|uniref:efflux RND transporter periplasmic adaptor subunit n=1 Tax=Brevundimonas sp. TaxID=1871086 RepID=UPI000DB83635|nr:efflux RND transporter periplasmic adaptor subunit [Brevundimonas sp.]PZT98202.1 MAG: efflux RND transporter periplasmic adaptor subunit [Brevundimonas sp.]
MPEPLEVGSKPKVLTLKRLGIGAVLAALAVVAFGVSTRASNDRDLKAISTDIALPTVAVVRPQKVSAEDGLILPGVIQALNSAPIHARTNGYVRAWFVDIGDVVSAGQTLAVLAAPELDEQLAVARAEYQTAQANENLARTTADRWKALLARGVVSQQATDEKVGDYAAVAAVANARLADMRRLEAQRGFTRLQAPFSGVITSRSAQVGALVAAGATTAEPLFTVSDTHRVRIYVNVPQSLSASLRIGTAAKMRLPEYPDREFDMVVTRSADSVDVRSGTVLVELQTANPKCELKPGAYAQVEFSDLEVGDSLHVPATALLFTSEGPVVAVLGPDNRVSIHAVRIGRDTGKTVEILAGVDEDARVVDNPPDAMAQGDKVRTVPPRV